MNDVVMMNLLRGNIVAKFEPGTVEEINPLRCEVRRMGIPVIVVNRASENVA